MYRYLRKDYIVRATRSMYRCLWKGYIVRPTRPITCTVIGGRIISCGQQDLLHVPLFEEGLYRASNKIYYMYRYLRKGYIVRATRSITCTVVCGRVISCGQQDLLHVPLFEEGLYRAGNKTYYMYRYLRKDISCGQQDLLHVPLFEEGLYRAGNRIYYMYRYLRKDYIVRATRSMYRCL